MARLDDPDTQAQLRHYSVSQVAKLLNLDRRTIYELITSGRLKAINLGCGSGARATWRIPESALRALTHADDQKVRL